MDKLRDKSLSPLCTGLSALPGGSEEDPPRDNVQRIKGAPVFHSSKMSRFGTFQHLGNRDVPLNCQQLDSAFGLRALGSRFLPDGEVVAQLTP